MTFAWRVHHVIPTQVPEKLRGETLLTFSTTLYSRIRMQDIIQEHLNFLEFTVKIQYFDCHMTYLVWFPPAVLSTRSRRRCGLHTKAANEENLQTPVTKVVGLKWKPTRMKAVIRGNILHPPPPLPMPWICFVEVRPLHLLSQRGPAGFRIETTLAYLSSMTTLPM